MSAFETSVVRDSRIQDISSKGHVHINKGAAENNYQTVTANSVSTSNVNFSVVVPSESIIVDYYRNLMFEPPSLVRTFQRRRYSPRRTPPG